MSLANFLLRNALGNDRAPDRLEVALFNAGREVTDPGYKRATVAKGSWHILNNKADVTATFGPFRGVVEFDRSVVFQGGNIIDEHALDGGPRRSSTSDVLRLRVELDLTAK